MTDTQGNKKGSPEFLPRGIDYLGNLGAKLRDLQGFKTLAYELIQNADDAPTATSMVFDIRDDALVVDNNGVFTDCGQVKAPECPWKTDKTKGHLCDFHRFRNIATGDKRGEEETTGAFGFGFIAVYQITDSPELISRGRHWIIHEDESENKRIKVCGGCPICSGSDLPGTRFILPWALDSNSNLRKKLMADAVSHDGPDRLYDELLCSLPTAMLFLKRLDSIEIKRNGICHRKYERVVENNNLIISQSDTAEDQIWYLISDDFSEVADTLRSEHPKRIEEKRSSKVSIAIPIGTAHPGVLCVCLPTEHKTDLPFHINADFFPTNDRKRVILDNDYQAKWNVAAIEASAQLLGNSIDLLPELLGPEGFWRFVKQIKDVYDNDENLFGKFWENIEPQLKTTKIVFTSINKWVVSRDAVLLLQKEEKPVIPILEKMGLNVVHEDLRPYQNLLRAESVGVPLLNIAKICQFFTTLGMAQRIESEKCPPFFTNRPGRISMWQEVNLLLNRQPRSPKNQEEDIEQLKKISLAPGRDGAFWPCCELFRADKTTITLFQTIDKSISFVAYDPEFAPLSEFLCSEFTVDNAIESLKESDNDILMELWKDDQIDLRKLFDWFEERRVVILNDENIKSAFSALHIFPSSGNLNRLSDLAIPGNFDDPLGLAKIVDLTAIGKHREFLISLGMQNLDFRIYAKQQLPAALQNQDVPPEKRRNAIKLLANRIGEIKDDQEVRDALKKSRLVECTDGEFRSPATCYFDTQAVRKCLGNDVHFAILPSDRHSAIHDLYKWIGVADEPRYIDLVTLIQTISQSPYSSESAQVIKEIVAHLGQRLSDDVDIEELELLGDISWLPAEGKTDRWYRPDEVYAPYRKHLFESQACFLDIPRNIQKIKPLLEFLKIESEPVVSLVVEHLLHCAANSLPVQNEVYKFLNDHADDSALERMKDERCLYFDDNYWAPSQVFWGEHRFGRYRRRLGEDLRAFNKLLEGIGVHDAPEYKDALSVLREISKEFGTGNNPLDDEAHAVLLECWRMLEEALHSNKLLKETIRQRLGSVKCIPDDRHLLNLPDGIFFENRARLAEKFDDFLEHDVIPQPIGAGRAMAGAGVRPLGSAVKVQLLERANPTEDNQIKERILKRRDQLGRVLEGNDVLSRLELLENLKYIAVTSLQIKYILDAFKHQIESKAESVSALYQKEEERLFFVHHNGQPPWTAVAREIAVALFPEEDPGKIALQIKAVLAPDSDEEVESELDSLGLPRIDIDIPRSLPDTEPIVRRLGDTSSTIPSEQATDIPSSFTPTTSPDDNAYFISEGSGSGATPTELTIDTTQSGKMDGKQKSDRDEEDYQDLLEKSFNKIGATQLQEHITDSGKVQHADRRREKSYKGHKERLHNEPNPNERRKETIRTILEGPDEQVREYLYQLYGGKCQICGKTFPERDGKSFFIANYIVPKRLARFVDTPANALCLCADHFARWQHGAVEAENISDQIKDFKTESEGGNGDPILRIKLCGEECKIQFKEKHLLDLQELLKASKNQK